MYNSILQYLQELATIIAEKANYENLQDIDSLAAELEKDCKDVARRMLKEIIEEVNLSIREDKRGRKEAGLYMHEKDRDRSLYTALGSIEFKRDYYKEKEGGYLYPLDEFLGIKARARIGSEVLARLAMKAVHMSYAMSSKEVTCGEVSRQSVHKLIRSMPILEKEGPEKKRTVRELHIYADEDHVHLQKPGKEKGKRSQIVPLVTVTEGTVNISKGRRKTVNPMHFVDENFDSKRLWTSVDGYIQSTYETDAIERICIHGDGGKWIQNGLDGYPQTIHVIDQWHFEKALKALSAKYPKKSLRTRIHAAVKAEDHVKAEHILSDLAENETDAKKLDAIEDFRTYLIGNWAAIKHRLNGDYPGSCTEGQVSHVLSDRFSRDPLGWSEKNLGKLTKLRTYVLNGGEVHAKDMKGESPVSSINYADRMEKLLKEKLDHPDFSMFESEPLILDVSSGTQFDVRSLGMCRPLS